MTKINVAESGRSVWTSLATPSTAEYETDVYADELPTAESMANEVMATNLVGGAASEPHDLLLEEEDDAGLAAPRRGTPQSLRDKQAPTSRDLSFERHSPTPRSFVPSRSPDLGSATFPLTPSIGPGSGLLGPEGGRSPARLRSGHDRDGTSHTFGSGGH